MTRIMACSLSLLLTAGSAAAEDLGALCQDSLDPVVAQLAYAVGEVDGGSGYAYCAFASGAALSAGYRPDSGLHLPLKQLLLWPGNVFTVADSTYVPGLPGTTEEAFDFLLKEVAAGRWCLIYARQPVIVHAVDSSFGDPWFFVARCDGGRVDTTIWDLSDLRAQWWWWTDWPGVNSIWPFPERPAPELGRLAMTAGMRNLVLAARPDSSAAIRDAGVRRAAVALAARCSPPSLAAAVGTDSALLVSLARIPLAKRLARAYQKVYTDERRASDTRRQVRRRS